MYPQTTDEADKFHAGLIKSLHSDQTRDANMKILMDNRVPVAARLATLVSNIMTAMLARIRKQAGRKPHIKMLVAAIKMLIIEASRMALIAGVEVTDDDKRKAAKLAGDMLEAGNSPQGQQPMQGQPQGQPTPQQPQGIVGGAM